MFAQLNRKMKRDIAIYGIGGLGREIACVIKKINELKPTWNFIGFFDDFIEIGTRNVYGSVIGGIDELNNHPSPLSIVFGIANGQIVKTIFDKVTSKNIDYPNIIAPDVTFMDTANYCIGKGNFLNMGCLISCNVKIGDFNSMGAYSTIGHDTKLGNFNVVMPSTQICGNVSVGNSNFFGISSIVLQQLNIEENVTIGCSSVLMVNAIEGYTYFGNPAKPILKTKLKHD